MGWVLVRFLLLATLVLSCLHFPVVPAHSKCSSGPVNWTGQGGCLKRSNNLAGLYSRSAQSRNSWFGASPNFFQGQLSIQPLVIKSSNRRLSNYSVDSRAELSVLCQRSRLNVMIDFPGYPMAFNRQAKPLAYEIDGGQVWKSKLYPGNNYSTVGIWKSSEAEMFLKTIVESDVVHLHTQDEDSTRLHATFVLKRLRYQLSDMIAKCVA